MQWHNAMYKKTGAGSTDGENVNERGERVVCKEEKNNFESCSLVQCLANFLVTFLRVTSQRSSPVSS